MKNPTCSTPQILSVCPSGLSALTTPRWLDGFDWNLVAVHRRGGNRFCTKKKLKKIILKICDFSGILFFIGTFFFFFFADGIFGTLLKCIGEIGGNRERDSSVSLPPCLPSCLPACQSACPPAWLSPLLPACLTACLPYCLAACLPARQPARLHDCTPCLVIKKSDFENSRFFGNTYFYRHFFFFAEGIFGTLLKCIGGIGGTRERDSSVSLPPCLPAFLPACLSACPPAWLSPLLPACLTACLLYCLAACLPARQPARLHDFTPCLIIEKSDFENSRFFGNTYFYRHFFFLPRAFLEPCSSA
jgi:hypothetical protein